MDPNCALCKNIRSGFPLVCNAYPNGIPQEIISGMELHNKPLPGDNGIQFEPIDEAEPQTVRGRIMPSANQSIQIEGIDKLIEKLGKVEGPKVLVEPMEWSVRAVEDTIKPYPPTRPGQTYRRGQDPRSEDLGGRWTSKVKTSGRGVIGKIGNNASYAPWVQSHQFQAWMHRGRWTTDLQAINRNRKNIERRFKLAIDKALR